MRAVRLLSIPLFIALASCGGAARLPLSAGIGPDPALPPPERSLIPVVDIAPATGWPQGVTPVAAPGHTVRAFASGLDHPRSLYVLPNGDVLVAETNAPPRPKAAEGLKGLAMKFVMKRMGAAVPSANRITLLRDANRDGVAEIRTTFLEELNSPFGMALVGSTLYVANTDAVVRFPYQLGETRITAPAVKVVDLPAGPRNYHWTKGLVASADGRKLYVSVGSNSNVAEHGMDEEAGRAAIWEIDAASGEHRIFAWGLRNAVSLAWEPASGALWAVVNERDELGSDLVPDYLTSVRQGGFYGWPFSYWGQRVDERVQPQRPDLVARAIKPDYGLGAHVAPLGLAFSRDGAFVGQHGSWNRRPPSGYNVVFVPFQDGMPSGPPAEVLSGFRGPQGEGYGRPVGVALDRRGGLLVADDVGNVVWRVSRD